MLHSHTTIAIHSYLPCSKAGTLSHNLYCNNSAVFARPYPFQEEILDVHAALTELAAAEPRLAQVVELRYFGGMVEADIATALGVTERTVRRDWQKARLMLAAVLRA